MDIALLVAFFGFYDDSVKGRTRVQKDICILKYNDKIPFNFDFNSHYYGPYSSELTDTMDTMVASGFIKEVIMILPQGILRYDYRLTEEGKKLFANIKKVFEQKSPNFLTEFKTKIERLKGKTLSQVVTIAKDCSGIQSSI